MLAGSSAAPVHELFRSQRLEALLKEAREQYDYVVLDTPPLGPVSDCALLARWIDGVLVVVAAHRTSRKLLEEALNLLDGASVLGIIFNGDDRPFLKYRRHYYRGYFWTRSHSDPRRHRREHLCRADRLADVPDCCLPGEPTIMATLLNRLRRRHPSRVLILGAGMLAAKLVEEIESATGFGHGLRRHGGRPASGRDPSVQGRVARFARTAHRDRRRGPRGPHRGRIVRPARTPASEGAARVARPRDRRGRRARVLRARHGQDGHRSADAWSPDPVEGIPQQRHARTGRASGQRRCRHHRTDPARRCSR